MWEKSYGGPGTDRSYSIDITRDGGFALYGSTTSAGSGGVDGYLIKVDSTGNKEWERTYGTNQFDMGHDVQECGDGTLLLTGYTEGYGAAGRDGWLILTDSAGAVIRQQTMGGPGEYRLLRGIERSGGGFAAAGFRVRPESMAPDLFFTHANEQLDKVSSQSIAGDAAEVGYGLAESPDGGIVITGWVDDTGDGLFDLLLIKFPRPQG